MREMCVFLADLMRADVAKVIVLPAGTAHRAIDTPSDFKMVGAYPDGCVSFQATAMLPLNQRQTWDMQYENTPVKDLPVPKDPLGQGKLEELWKT
jgi:uncharacterized protein YjlB